MKELDFSLPYFPPEKFLSKEDSYNLNSVGLYIIQKLREEDLRESHPYLNVEESNFNSNKMAEELDSKFEIVELILNNRDILMNLEDFYEEDCQLSLLNWAWNIHRRFFSGKKSELNSFMYSNHNLSNDTRFYLNKDLLFKNNCLYNKAEILLFNILNIFEIFPIKPDDLKSLNFIGKLRDIKKEMKSRNLILYKKIKKLIKFWKKMINFFDIQNQPKLNSDINKDLDDINHNNFFEISLKQKRRLENLDTDKKDKNESIDLSKNKKDCENMSTNLSLDETESGEHKIKKKSVTWKNQDSLVEKIEYNPMNAPLEF